MTRRTKAVVPVHYAGVGCEMDGIMDVAQRQGVAVIEDNAHGFFGAYRGKPLGAFGQFAALSFHETKSFWCGEGGAFYHQRRQVHRTGRDRPGKGHERFGGKEGDCPVTEDVSDRLLRLPFYNDLTEQDQQRVVEAVKEFG